VGPGAPLASLGWETGVMDMELRIWKEKLMLVRHLRSLGEETLASMVYREQVEREWPGLAQEAKEICCQLEIENCNETVMDRNEYKKVIEKALSKKNEKLLRDMADGKTKCSKIMEDNYGKKPYIGETLIGEVRQWYRTRVGLLPFAGNYSHDRKYAKTEWLCRCLEAREEEHHIRSGECPAYNDLLEKYEDLSSDGDLVNFFKEVLERRDMIDEVEEEERREEEEEEAEERGHTLAAGRTPLMPAS
jgi:Zn-dependent M32 family carboxypeptidase